LDERKRTSFGMSVGVRKGESNAECMEAKGLFRMFFLMAKVHVQLVVEDEKGDNVGVLMGWMN
jgi:hypothetical protein